MGRVAILGFGSPFLRIRLGRRILRRGVTPRWAALLASVRRRDDPGVAHRLRLLFDRIRQPMCSPTGGRWLAGDARRPARPRDGPPEPRAAPPSSAAPARRFRSLGGESPWDRAWRGRVVHRDPAAANRDLRVRRSRRPSIGDPVDRNDWRPFSRSPRGAAGPFWLWRGWGAKFPHVDRVLICSDCLGWRDSDGLGRLNPTGFYARKNCEPGEAGRQCGRDARAEQASNHSRRLPRTPFSGANSPHDLVCQLGGWLRGWQ